MRLFALLLALLTQLACGTAYAQAYRWVDQNGKTRYGDVPPPGVKATALKSPSGGYAPQAPAPAAAANDAKGAAKGPVDPAQAFNERRLKEKEDAEKADKERAGSEQRQKNCERSKGYLSALESGQRISTTSPQGERAFLDDAGRQAQLEETRAEIAKNCK
jgi:Domain of unknown function (DUF4124)